MNPRAAGHWLNAVEHLLHQLRWLVKHYLVVELGHQTLLRVDYWRRLSDCSIEICDGWSVGVWRLKELQNVIKCYRS